MENRNMHTFSANITNSSVYETAAKGLGTAAKLAAKGFAGAIVGGVKLTTNVILPAAVKGTKEAVEFFNEDKQN